MWALIKESDWTKDHDYTRIGKKFRKLLSREDCTQLFKFIDDKQQKLDTRFEKAWLGKPGIPVYDDGWSDLTFDVVGRGEKFYKSITATKLRHMAKTSDYHENFGYVTLR
jgi:hypothetical protein